MKFDFKEGWNKDFCLVFLHGDEKAAKKVTLWAQKKFNCGALVFEGEERLVDFSFYDCGESFQFDPNRIWFSDKKNIDMRFKNMKPLLLNAFTAFVVCAAEYRLRCYKVIIALHNNGKTDFSLWSFVYGKLRDGIKRYFIADSLNPGDFFLVNQKKDFIFLKRHGFNVVLEGRELPEDGSLSRYCSHNKKRFFNIEVKARESLRQTISIQKKMLEAIIPIVLL